MEVVCKAAQYADATNPSRRASGVLSALQSSLANLYAKAKRPSDAFQACGSAIAMLPREKLENPDKHDKRRQSTKSRFCFSQIKAIVHTQIETIVQYTQRNEDSLDFWKVKVTRY